MFCGSHVENEWWQQWPVLTLIIFVRASEGWQTSWTLFFFFFFLMLSRNFPLIDRFLWSKWGPNSSESWMVLAVFGFLFLRSFMTATLCKLFHRSLSVLLSCTCRDVSWSIWFLCVSWGFVINLILVHVVRFRDQFDSCTCCEVSWSIRFYALSIVCQIMAVTCFPSNHVT